MKTGRFPLPMRLIDCCKVAVLPMNIMIAGRLERWNIPAYRRASTIWENSDFGHMNFIYSRLSLSRLRLSRITAYLEEKSDPCLTSILTSGNKILWIRGEIAPQEQFLPFSTIFQHIFPTKGVELHVHLWNLVVRLVFSSILHIWYVEVRIYRSVSEGPFDFEISRVDCNHFKYRRKK